MSLSTVLADVAEWGSDAEKLLASATPVLGEIEAGFNSLTAVAKLLTQWNTDMQTPAMVNASVAEKLQAFKDRINLDLQTGDEADLEKLEAQ